MKTIFVIWSLILILGLTLLAGCDGGAEATGPLNTDNVNLIFVVSPDLANDPLGDINPVTANLSNRGLTRSLLMWHLPERADSG